MVAAAALILLNSLVPPILPRVVDTGMDWAKQGGFALTISLILWGILAARHAPPANLRQIVRALSGMYSRMNQRLLHGHLPVANAHLTPQAEVKQQNTRVRWVYFCFWGLLFLQVAGIWTLRHFPSQDGPSHLYNAAVVARYNQIPVFRDFYTIHLSAAGNILAQALQWVLLKVADDFAAEKVLLTLYAILLPLSFRTLLGTVNAKTSPFMLIGLVIFPNFFLFMGFWNFCLSIPLALFTLSWFRTRRCRSKPTAVVGLAVLSFLTYSAHLLSWAVLAAMISIEIGIELFRAMSAHELRRAFRGYAPAAAAVYGPALFAVAYLNSGAGRLEFGGSLVERAWPLYSAAFLRGLGHADKWLSYAFAGITCLLSITAVVCRHRERRLRSTDVFLLFALACALLSVLGPGGAGPGAYLRDRLALYAWTFQAIWLASMTWPRKIEASAMVAIAALAVAVFAFRVPSVLSWSRQLSEYAAARERIVPGSTILPIQMETRFPSVDPMLHAEGWWPLTARSTYEITKQLCPTSRSGFGPIVPRTIGWVSKWSWKRQSRNSIYRDTNRPPENVSTTC
jgi:hypothetical protein